MSASENDPSLARKLAALKELETIIETLRGPNGCPWDRKQTLATLSANFLEEACEVIDAIQEAGQAPADPGAAGPNADPDICEELGDVLMNVFLAARIAEENRGFSLEDVAQGIGRKLVRRHPHVFGTGGGPRESIAGVDGVLSRWNELKAQEKAQKAARRGTLRPHAAGETFPTAPPPPPSALDGIPRSLPALEAAFELGRKAARVGFDWPLASEALQKVHEEIAEVEARFKSSEGAGDAAREELQDEIGDLLFAVINFSRKLEISPEGALRRTMKKFRRRFGHIEQRLREESRNQPPTLEEMEKLWQEAKTLES